MAKSSSILDTAPKVRAKPKISPDTQPAVTLGICLFLALVTLAAYWPVTRAEFINYDDNEYVTNNPMVLGGLSWQGIKWAFMTRHASNWHPLTWISHMLDVTLFGKNPAGPHAVNLGLHVLNTVLCFWLFLIMTSRRWRSAMVAGLFALHPFHVESVAWVAERKDVLSAFFFFLTLLAYSRYVRSKESVISSQPSIVRSSKFFYGLSVCLFALGLMSKPMLVTLPFVLLLLDYWPFGRASDVNKQVPLLLEKIPFFAISAAACATTVWAQEKAIQPLEHLRLSDRLANAAVAYCLYIFKAFWPTRLALPYLHPGQWPGAQVLGALVLIVAISAVAWAFRKRRPSVLVGWLWFLGMLVPVIGLVQVGTQAMADRYTYLPLIGLLIMVVWVMADLGERARIGATGLMPIGALAILACAILTFRQAGYWRDSETLFKHANAVTKGNFIAVANVGGVFFESGQLEEALKWYRRSYEMNPRYPEAVNSIGAIFAAQGKDEAVDWFQKALELQPSHLEALYNMGNAMAKKGRTEEAIGYYERSVRVKPDNFEARNNLANALMTMRRFDEAIEQYKTALRYQPREGLIHKNLGEALAAKGRLDEATSEYRRALAFTNDPGTHYSLGLALAVQAKWDRAIEQFQDTLRLSSTNAEAHYNLGYALRMSGKPTEAEIHLRQALHFRPELPLAHYNLACVLTQQGRNEEAITHLQEALRQKPDYAEADEKLKALNLKETTGNR